ncbi:hypothetical protein ABZ851_14820 [Streptomyces sp. NPDC047049]|uniref:hypothetical protein n=1 Tax=Streptomyces sp. NPDC047049 TaxID=3156688 RepID=UPI0033FE561E
MNGIKIILRTLHHGERNLAEGLTTAAQRHRAEHEVHHIGNDLATWSKQHVQRLSETAADYGLTLDGLSDAAPSDSVFATLIRNKASEAVGHRPEPGLLLLRDLRQLHLAAAENSLHWEMLAQAAQATKDDRLLSLSSTCHPQTLRQMRWTNTLIKTLSPQILTSL